jgi:hypothetical protein
MATICALQRSAAWFFDGRDAFQVLGTEFYGSNKKSDWPIYIRRRNLFDLTINAFAVFADVTKIHTFGLPLAFTISITKAIDGRRAKVAGERDQSRKRAVDTNPHRHSEILCAVFAG